MTNNSYVGIPDRLKCTAVAGDYVALSSQIVTPSNPDDLEHSTLRKQSDINTSLDNRLEAVEDRVTTEVEIEPSYNSTNLITSGGVYSAISDFANDTETGSVAADGVLHNGYYWSRTVHKLDAGESITVLPTHMIESQVAWATNPLDPTAVVTGRFTYVSMENGATVLVGFLSNDSYSYTITKKKISVSASVRQDLTAEQLALARLNIGINSIDIQDGSVTTSKLANGAVTGAKIAEGTITSSNLAPGIELPYNITDGSITTAKLHDNAVTASKLDSSIANAVSAVSGKQDQLVSGTNIKTVNSQSLLGSGNIEISTTIADGSITTAKLANNAVTTAKLDSSIASVISTVPNKLDQLISGTNIKTINNLSLLGSGNVEISVPTKVSELSNDSGYISEIADYTITRDKISNMSVTSNKLSSDVQTLLDTSGAQSNGSILTMGMEYTDDEIQNVHDEYLENAAYFGDYNGEDIIDDFGANDILRTDISQTFTETQTKNLKKNIFNKAALSFTVDSGYSIEYLDQHIVNNENVLTQEDLGDPDYKTNTIFVIDYDFKVLGTSENPVKVPNNCKLLFLGGEFKQGYLNINEAEVLPNYGNLVYNSYNEVYYPGMLTTIIGNPKKGSWYFNHTENKPVYFDGTDWIFADGTSVGSLNE